MKFTFGPESRPLDGYTIKRAIARGGFGEVYYALTDSGKEVAIKLLQENLEVELRGVTQCLNLKHPNLVTLFDIKQDRDADHWIVMEFVGGKTLDRVIHEAPNGLPLEEVLAWLDGIAAGIGYLHDRGIVHRDLKPANIFRENGVVKVGDVGLSKFIAPSRRSAHTQSVGTVYYMAPEVAKGRYGREVDVYSLAVILYELLTGKVPFDGETTAEILMKHLTERPNLSAISPNLRTVFEAALEKDPERRTGDVLELARQFRDAARDGVNEPLEAGDRNGADYHEIHAERLRICSQLRRLLDNARELETAADRDRTWNQKQSEVESLVQQAQAIRDSAFDRDKRLWDYSAEGTLSSLIAIADKFRRLATARLPILEHADTQPYAKPAASDKLPPRPSLFPDSSTPKSGWESFCHSCEQSVRGLKESVRAHPLLAWLAVGSFIMWILPRLTGVNVARIAGGTKLIWLVFGGLAAFEIFRLVSRSVDWLFASTVSNPNARGSRGVRLQNAAPGRAVYRVVSPNSVREISWRRRLTELSGSLATAGLATAVVTAVLANVTQFFGSTAMIGHFATGTLIGSWGLLILGKLREGLPRERYIDRMLLAGVGMVIGVTLFQLDDWLLINLLADGSSTQQSLLSMTSASLSSDSRHLLAESYIAFFATLFGLRRWWWHTDSFRPHRFRVLSVCLTALIGSGAALAWGFPVLWGTVWAAILSSVVQLAAVWTPREQRR
ncbi:MAG: serine/threonine protein kinase [Planctomycetaceae bacterium]|nr:serine/threonine protein kinase [Planctomycetaceae bacterium]